MTSIFGASASGGSFFRNEYQSLKQRMWETFCRLSFGERLAVLLQESWGMLLFVGGLVVYHALAPRPYRLVMRLFDMSAMAQTPGSPPIPPAWALALVAAFYVFLMLILVACVVFLLTAPGKWSNRHSWAAKTATFLLGFLTKAIEEWVRIAVQG